MSIDGGKVLLRGGTFLLDGIQSVDTSRNTPKEVTKELGNEKSVSTDRDIPESTVTMTSWDTSAEIEAILTRVDPSTYDQPIDLGDVKPWDLLAPHKGADESKVATHGVILPYLGLTSAAYRFGVDATASQDYTFGGDYEWTGPGTPLHEEFDGAGAGPYEYTTPNALSSPVRGTDRFVFSVCVFKADGSHERLSFDEYVDTGVDITLLDAAKAPVGSTVCISYFTDDHQTYLQAIHPTATVKPRNIKGKDIKVYVGVQGETLISWKNTQSVNLNWSRQGTAVKEMGSVQRVATEYQTPEVTGDITIRPSTLEYWYLRQAEVSGTPVDEVVNILNREVMEIFVVMLHPSTGVPLKGFRVPDCSIEAAPFSARVSESKNSVFPIDSNDGTLEILTPAAMTALGISG
jgi:hypothetical protein